MINRAKSTRDKCWTGIGLLWAGGLYIVSFFLPVVREPFGDHEVINGWQASLTMLENVFDLPVITLQFVPLYLSNFLFWAAVWLWTVNRFRRAAVVGILALVCGSFFPGDPRMIHFTPADVFDPVNPVLGTVLEAEKCR